jgi:hypothetical protein
MYAGEYAVSGVDVAREFGNAGVWDYLLENYEVLYTQGWRFILPLINDYMNNQTSHKDLENF